MQKHIIFLICLFLVLLTVQISLAQEVSTNNTSDSETQGEILEGLTIDKAKASENENYKAEEKSSINQSKMENQGRWIATDYIPGDINSDKYTVQKGDTLWEIAESRYSDASKWLEIVKLNPGKIGTLPSGQQALIIPGQILDLKAE